MIALRGAQVRWGRTTALDGVDLRLQRGEIVGLIGPPEAGKTTLLKVLAGLVPQPAGRMQLDGAVVDPGTDAWRRRIGFAFQNDALFDALTVFDNVAFPLRRRRLPEAEIQARTTQALQQVQLEHAAEAMPDSISGGMRKRVGLARAAIIRPELGLFDDPVAGLDPQTSARILIMLVDLVRQAHMACIIVTNELEVLLPLCHRVVMLLHGRAIYDGDVAGLRQSSRAEVVQFVTGADEGPL